MIVEVVLLKDVPKVGQKGQSIKVKGGFFRNFLSPRGLAAVATPKLLEKAAEVNAKIAAELEKAKTEAKELANALQGAKFKVVEKLTKKGKLYKQISNEQIKEIIEAEAKVALPVKAVNNKAKIKEPGTFDITLNLGHDQAATVKLTIAGEDENKDS